MYTWQKCIVLETEKIRKMLKNLRVNRGERNPYIYRHIYRNSKYENESERKGARETAGEAHPGEGHSRSAAFWTLNSGHD